MSLNIPNVTGNGDYCKSLSSPTVKALVMDSKPGFSGIDLTNLRPFIKVIFVLTESYITVLVPGLGFT